jgi:chromosomal replication initiation ATPase DnaA
MKHTGLFDRVRFLEARLDRLEVVILEQDKIIRAQSAALGVISIPEHLEPEAKGMMGIVADIARDNGLTLPEIKSDSKLRAVCWPRQMAYAALLDAGFSAAGVGRFFGKDHTTVLDGAGKARERIKRLENGLPGKSETPAN